MNKSKWSLAIALLLSLLLAFGAPVSAFSDIAGDPGEASIQALKEQGLVSGLEDGRFAPKDGMTYAQGVHLLVKAFKLNIDHIRFIKEPKASDFFSQISDDAWFSEDFIIAHLNGLPLAENVNPYVFMTREAFADLLCKAVLTTGQYAFIEMFILIGDADRIAPERMGSIQTLLIAQIAKLDQDHNFRPTDGITRSEAAVLLNEALKFVKEHGEPHPPAGEQATVSIVPVSNEINRIVLSRGEKPNPGYRITVESITFRADETALIRYRLHDPDPNQSYAQVITEAKTETYVASRYQIVTEAVR